MRIALVILHADRARGGAERYTLELAAALAARGHDVSLLATTFADIPPNVRPILLPAAGATRTRRYLRMLDALDAHLRDTHYDIVHAMLPVRRCDVYHPHAGLAVAARMSPLKRLFNPRRARFAAVEHRLLTSATPPLVLCLSEYVKREVTSHYALPPDKLATLFNAVDLDYFQPPPARPQNDPPVALMIAQDFERKGLRQTLQALASTHPIPALHVVGKDDPAAYERLARALRIDSSVHFLGATSDPRPHYRAADFFILPTRHDPCSLVVLEALAMGLPVISTKFNGATEIMTDGTHGCVLDEPNAIGAIAGAMSMMLDSNVRRRMSDACLQLRPQLSYDRHIDRLLEIYAGVISSKS